MRRKRGEWRRGERVEWRAVRVSCGQVKCVSSEKKKEKRSDPGGGRTHDLSLRRRMRFHCATGPSMKRVKKSLMKGSQTREEEREGKKGLRRESNPGHPHPKRVFYHLTTKPSGKESRER